MSRRRSPHRGSDSRKLSEEDLLDSLDSSLTTLSHLARTYDAGHAPVAFLMATEVQKILSENSAAVRLRGSRTFPSPDRVAERTLVSAFHKLTGVRIDGTPPRLTFVPKFCVPETATIELLFRDWWNKDVIYRASAAPKGMPAGWLPVNGGPEVPFDQREHLNRRGLVKLLRDKLGAHQSDEMPRLLDELQSSKNWGSFAVRTPEGVLSTDDGSLRVVVDPLPAMMRQVAHEVLLAYERDDPAPQS